MKVEKGINRYIGANLARGYSLDSIAEVLKKNGYPAEYVGNAMARFRTRLLLSRFVPVLLIMALMTSFFS